MRAGEAKYPHIFSPWKLKNMETKNRIKYAATETNFNLEDGYVHDRDVAYMEAIARGGPGIVTTQGAFTDPTGLGWQYQDQDPEPGFLGSIDGGEGTDTLEFRIDYEPAKPV